MPTLFGKWRGGDLVDPDRRRHRPGGVHAERALFCHRSQINSAAFLNGVRTVLKRENVVEAISICDATPGPVARLESRQPS